MSSWIRQVPGFRSGRWWKKTIAVIGYAVIIQLIAAGLFGGTIHRLVTNVLGLPALVIYLQVGPLVNALGPPFVATQAFLMVVYILNARASTFLFGAESLAVVLLAANAWGVRSHIPILNSPSKILMIAGWVLFLSLAILAVASTVEKRPWGFLRA